MLKITKEQKSENSESLKELLRDREKLKNIDEKIKETQAEYGQDVVKNLREAEKNYDAVGATLGKLSKNFGQLSSPSAQTQ